MAQSKISKLVWLALLGSVSAQDVKKPTDVKQTLGDGTKDISATSGIAETGVKPEGMKPDSTKPQGDAVGKKPPPRDIKETLAECMKTNTKTECAAQVAEFLPDDPNAAKGAMDTMLKEGATDVVADEMIACKAAGKTKAECANTIKDSMKSILGEDVSEDDVKAYLQDAGKQKAVDAIKDCVAAATSQKDKKACQMGDAAKEEFAKASGKDLADITEDDLKKAAKDGAVNSIKDFVKACMANGTSVEECRSPEVLGDKMMEFGFEEASNEKMMEFLERGAQDEAKNALKACKGLSGTAATECMDAAKSSFAQASGKRPEDIKKFDMTKGAKEALERELSEKMELCVGTAADDAATVKSCRDKMKDIIKESSPGGKAPTDAQMAKQMRGGAERAALEASQNCESGEDCEDKMKEAMAKALGRPKDDIKKMELKKMAEEGAKKAAAQKATACAEAKAANESAVCEDLLASYMQLKGQALPSDPKKKDVAKKKIAKVLVTSMMKDSATVCLEEASAADFETCMQEASSSLDGALEDLVGDKNAKRSENKKKASAKKAMKLAVGELFGLCMSEAGGENATDADKAACKAELTDNVALAGLGGKADEAADRFISSVFSDPLEACADAELKTCRQEAKELAIQYGMVKREYVMSRRIGTVAAVAEVLAACKEVEGATDADCLAEAEAAFVKATGGTADAYVDIKKRVENLAEAILNGTVSELRKDKMLHLAFIGGSACDGAKADELLKKINATNVTGVENATVERCTVCDDVAEYTFVVEADKVPLGEVDATADALEQELAASGVNLARRLQVSDLDVYAAQDQTECAEGDTDCDGKVDVVVDDSGSSTGGDGDGNAGGDESSTTAGDGSVVNETTTKATDSPDVTSASSTTLAFGKLHAAIALLSAVCYLA